MLLLAHRGYRDSPEICENSLDAFQRAADMGADGIETDVRMTADGVPVLIHDRVVSGCKVAELDYRELCRICRQPVVTLAEAIQPWPDMLWNLEIKEPAAADAVVNVVHQHRDTHRFLITSFWHNVIQDVSGQLSHVDCGVLVAHHPCAAWTTLFGSWRPAGNVNTVVWDFEVFDNDCLITAEKLGLRCAVYGVHTQEEHEFCRQLGLHAVITDQLKFAVDSADGKNSG